MNSYRSFSIPCNDQELFDLERAKAKHLKKLNEITLAHSNRIDNNSPVNYSNVRKVGKRFRLNREFLIRIHD